MAALFRWRRDVRRFRTDPVPPETVVRLIALAATAPSVGLSEPWRFVLVESAAARALIRENFVRCNESALAARGEDRAAYARLKLAGLDCAPVQIAAFAAEADPKGRGLGTRTMPEMKRYSVVCAVMQLWLAARAEGLGLGWVSILEPEVISRACAAPADWAPVAYLCLGWPEEAHDDPELQRAGWEPRDLATDRLTRV
ncbi:MAG: 5,6-dimethylbenzimidazole synthase [Pikeienuella sp.]